MTSPLKRIIKLSWGYFHLIYITFAQFPLRSYIIEFLHKYKGINAKTNSIFQVTRNEPDIAFRIS